MKYKPFTITMYTFLVAAVSLIPVTKLWQKLDLLLNGEVLLYSIGLGLIPTVIAYFLYTWGLEKTEGSKAAIIATIEPVVATLLGVFLYGEKLVAIQLAGALLILSSVIIVNLSFGKKKITKSVEETV